MSNKIIDLTNVFKDFKISSKSKLKTQCVVTLITSPLKIDALDQESISNNPLTHGGGENTNKSGLIFEKKTCLYSLCKKHGFIDNYDINCKSKMSIKHISGKELICCTKNSFKKIINTKYQKEMYREPDDAFIINNPGHNTKIYIIEKKAQFQSGSIDEKLFAVKYYLEDYKLNFGDGFDIKYILCVSSYLWDCIEKPINKNKKFNKWKNYKNLMASPDIFIINGDNDYESQIKTIISELC